MGMHHPIKPIAASENDSNHKRLASAMWGEDSVVNSQNPDLGLHNANSLLVQAAPHQYNWEYNLKAL
jgi:hypothetical protein